MLGVTYGALLWADMNAATPDTVRPPEDASLHIDILGDWGPLRPHATPFPEETPMLGVIHGVLLWAGMNAATPDTVRPPEDASLHVGILGGWGRNLNPALSMIGRMLLPHRLEHGMTAFEGLHATPSHAPSSTVKARIGLGVMYHRLNPHFLFYGVVLVIRWVMPSDISYFLATFSFV